MEAAIKELNQKECKIPKLDQKERDILYYFVLHKLMANVHEFGLGDLLKEYKDKYEPLYIEKTLLSLVAQGYLSEADGNIGIPDVTTLNKLKRLFLRRRVFDWFRRFVLQTWQFVWKHFIVTIIISVITAYLTTKLIG